MRPKDFLRTGLRKIEMMGPSIEELILNGVIEVSGVSSETGELLYSFTSKLSEIMPGMWKDKLASINKEIMFFWEMGFLDVDDAESNNPVVSLTELALDPDAIASLPEDKQKIFIELKKLFER